MRKNITETEYKISKKTFLTVARYAYDALNKTLFNGELPKIPLRVSDLSNEQIYQAAAAFKIERRNNSFWIGDKYHPHTIEHISIEFDEIITHFSYNDDIIPNFLFRIFDTVCHEMAHEYCYMHGIKDCNDDQYHNYQFMMVAEEHGMHCEFDKEYGFQDTILTDKGFCSALYEAGDEILDTMMYGILSAMRVKPVPQINQLLCAPK